MQPEAAVQRRSPYFSVVSTLLLALSLVAFSDNLFTDVGQPSNRDPKFIVHGLFGLAWYGLLTTQAHLVRVGNRRLHRRVGVATLLVALGVTLSTLYVFVVLWKGWSHLSPEDRSNRLLLPGFVVCLAMAWQHRARPEWHRRWVLVGTFFMLAPVLARTYDPLIASWARPVLQGRYTATVDEIAFQLYFWSTWVAALLSLLVHDHRLQRRPHPVTTFGRGCLASAFTRRRRAVGARAIHLDADLVDV